MQSETLPAGTILHGRYRIERALGSGGFGHVYLSVDLQTRAQYAIKEYIVSGASGKAQLEHEVQVLRNLHHPNLPALLSAFDDGGHYYVVLGYIEGNDLTDYLRVARQKNEPVPLARLMEWLLSICDAVAFLHSQHPPIIHRDIKPDNIRITPDGTAILVDLGNAKTAADGARTLFFIRHQGTPGYAPLEQYPGGTGTDERSDVYALGGTLYFALTAHEPPSVTARNQALQQKQPDLPGLPDLLAQNPPEGPQEQRQFRLGISKPAKPQLRHSRHLAQLRTLPPELLRKLDSIIQRAMAMRPRDRYQSVADFSRDLRMVLHALPSSTLPPLPRRSADPHSTQPDLPMLYEDLQRQKQADAASSIPAVPPAPPAPSAPTAPPVPPPANPLPGPAPALARCPRCNTELQRPSPYCPRCGTPLNPLQTPRGIAGQAEQGVRQNHKGPRQDISGEETLLISPSLSSLPQPGGSRPQTGGSTGSPSPGRQAGETLSQPVATARPGQVVSTARTVSTGNADAQAPAHPAQIHASTTVKPFITSTTGETDRQNHVALQIQVPPPPSRPTPTRQAEERARKLFISLAILFVTLIIIGLLLLVFLHNNH